MGLVIRVEKKDQPLANTVFSLVDKSGTKKGTCDRLVFSDGKNHTIQLVEDYYFIHRLPNSLIAQFEIVGHSTQIGGSVNDVVVEKLRTIDISGASDIILVADPFLPKPK